MPSETFPSSPRRRKKVELSFDSAPRSLNYRHTQARLTFAPLRIEQRRHVQLPESRKFRTKISVGTLAYLTYVRRKEFRARSRTLLPTPLSILPEICLHEARNPQRAPGRISGIFNKLSLCFDDGFDGEEERRNATNGPGLRPFASEDTKRRERKYREAEGAARLRRDDNSDDGGEDQGARKREKEGARGRSTGRQPLTRQMSSLS